MARRTDIATVLGHDARQRIVLVLTGSPPLTVGQLVKKTGISQSQVSKHLEQLRSARLISSTPTGIVLDTPADTIGVLEALNRNAVGTLRSEIAAAKRSLREEESMGRKLQEARRRLEPDSIP
jgi:DNA-binding transcriptional ArsR family regulator